MSGTPSKRPTGAAREKGGERRWRFPRFHPLREFGEALTPHTIVVSAYALVVGVMAGYVAFALLKFIYLLTGFFFHGVWSSAGWNPLTTPFGAWVILIPLIGGLPVSLMVYFCEPTLTSLTPDASLLSPAWM